MTDFRDPYQPTPAVLEPAPEDHPGRAPDGHVSGPFTFGSLVAETVAMFRFHFWWAMGLLVVPLASASAATMLAGDSKEYTAGLVLSQILLIFIVAPLSAAAEGALLWRLAGSGEHGPLERNPFVSLFYGFRYFGWLFLYGLVVGAVLFCLFLPSLIIFLATLVEFSGGGNVVPVAEAPVAWGVLAVVSIAALVGTVYMLARWAAAMPLLVAECRPLGDALKESGRLVRGRAAVVMGFFVLLNLVARGLPAMLEQSGLAMMEQGWSSAVSYLLIVVALPFSLSGGLLSNAGNVALYRRLRDTRPLDETGE